MRGALIFVLLAVAPALTAAQEHTDLESELPREPGAVEHFDKGQELYAADQFAAALEEFQQGYAIEGKRVFLYMMGQAERYRGNCKDAIARYREFLAAKPPADQRAKTIEALSYCGAGENPDPVPVETAAIPPAEPRPDAAKSKPSPRRWYKDPYGYALSGAGLATMGLGVSFWLAGRRATDAADSAATIAIYEDKKGESADKYTAAKISFGVGVGLAALGAARFLWVAKSSSASEEATAFLWVDHGLTGLAYAGTF